MKKFLFLAAFIATITIANAQVDSSAKNFAKYQNIPSFTIYTVPDSTGFTNKNLDKKKPLVIMFFSPDCDHCQKETKELMAYKTELKDVQLLMLSPANYPTVKQFYIDYGLAAMPNIKMGQDVNYALGSIYQLRTFPSMFVYSNTGKLLKVFAGNIGVPAILEALK